MAAIDLIHLVWRDAGIGQFRKFLESYRSHVTGVDHRLVLLFNGFHDRAEVDTYRIEASGMQAVEEWVPYPVLDLAAYFWVASRSEAKIVCFVNSYSVVLVDGWLEILTRHLAETKVGAVGATGSWESFYTNYQRRIGELRPGWSPVAWALHLNRLRKLRRYRTNFDPYPNPHLRSNAFAIDRALWLSLRRPPLRHKWDTWLFESGKDGFTPQLRSMGLEVMVVGRDGVAHPPERWPESLTFRQGNQENLIVADNRTRQYDQGDDAARKYMREIAWGSSAPRRELSR